MMVDNKVSLRVLYTINSSPQYILARSHTRVPVDFIPCLPDNGNPTSSDASKCPPLYGSVLLKTCLDTICRSSPELTQDSNRDFSLYVLDPLESNSAPAPVNISNTNTESSYSTNNAANAEQPRGVAVGLGFMSWALTADDVDATTVVGTLVKQANGQQALEVIFALRETMAMKRPAWNIQPHSSQPPSSQESSTSLSGGQRDVKPSTSQGSPVYQHPTHSGSTMQTRLSTADTTRETLASIQMRAKAKIKPPKPIRQSTIPVTESDKFLNAGTYIGPLKKKGRPKAAGIDTKPFSLGINAVASGSGSGASGHPNDVIVIDGSDSEGTPPTPTAVMFSQSAKGKSGSKKRQPPPPFTTEPLITRTSAAESGEAPVQVKVEPQEGPSILDILAYLSATSSSEPSAQNAAILAALNTIDSSNTQGKQPDGSVPNPHLVSALKQLLSVYANAAPQPTTPEYSNPEIAKHPRQFSSHTQEEAVVVRNKENVNPVVYQKRPEDGKAKHSDVAIGPSSSPVSSHTSTQSCYPERHSHSLGRSSRSNENILQRAPLKDSVFSSGTEKVARKRTLSDFMDEREKGKGKERERIEKRDGHRHSNSQRPLKVAPVVDFLRHYPRILASNQPRAEQPANYYRVPLESMTSPARPRPDLDVATHNQADNVGEGSWIIIKSRTPSPRPSRVSASSPVRGIQNENRRKYVVPEWARTSTSTQPRLSEEAQRALEGAEERKKQERSAARKRLPSMQAKLMAKSILGTSQPNDNQTKALAPPLLPKPDVSRGPVIASSDRPMFPATNIHFPFVSSTRSSSPPPQANVVPQTPKTPTRERGNVHLTPGGENESLFTPMGSGGSLFGSARSYSLRTPVAPSTLTSPLGNRKKAKLSPMTSALTGKGFGLVSWTNSSSSAPTSSDSKDMEDDKASKKSLDRELEDALDDLECPPSSLPIASSDIDVDSSYLSVPGDGDVEIDHDNGDIPVKQHWAGLPPSSPPAPSSPMLLPEHDGQTDDEMDDLPIATSDNEVDTDMNGCDTDTPSLAIMSPCDDDTAVDNGNFSFFSLPEYTSAESEHISSSDLFEQFTNLNDHSDIFPGMDDIHLDPAMEEIFNNGLDTIDFTEFWATFKPLVDESTQSTQDQTIGEYFSQGQEDSLPSSFGEIDHAKLADEMQTLLSGCLM